MYLGMVFEGGGPKGMAYYGCLKVLEEEGILKNIKFFAGSSIGAFLAMLLACGCSMNDFQTITQNEDFTKLIDENYGIIGDGIRLVWRYGLVPGNELVKFVIAMIGKQFKQPEAVTFKSLYDALGTDLLVMGTNVTLHRGEEFSRFKTPDMPIWLAVSISMRFPGVFEPITMNNCLYSDGGIMNNMPRIFVEQYLPRDNILGLRLVTPKDVLDGDTIYSVKTDINNFVTFNANVISALWYSRENSDFYPNYWQHNIGLEVADYSIFHTKFTQEEKDKMFQDTRKQTKEFLLKRSQ